MPSIPTRHRGMPALLGTILLAFGAQANASSFSDIFFFGDSLTDSGNIPFVTGFPLPPYSPGVITGPYTDGTDGLVWAQHFATMMGNSAVASLLGGTNYAWAGATTGPVNAGLPPSVIDQSHMYLDDFGGDADPNALYTVFGGGNDVLDGDITDSIANIVATISGLAAAGAVNFFVPNLPDIGLAPGGNGQTSSDLSMDFNTQLSLALTGLETDLQIDITTLDVFSILNDILTNPGDFGFTNTTEVCWDGDFSGNGTMCADPDSYVFWDGIHPGAATHELLGTLAFEEFNKQVIPVPAALPLFLSALGVFGFAKRRRG